MTQPADDKPADGKLPVKYVLYTHYPNPDDKEFERWKSGTISLPDLESIKSLGSRVRSLRELLTAPGYEGLVVIFYALGLPKCFDAISQRLAAISERKTIATLVEEYPELRFASDLSTYISLEFGRDRQLQNRIRFITALDLYEIFSRASEFEADHLKKWFIGDTSDIHYDTPKIAEAIVRLRLLGNGVPVFRLDWDVLLREKTDVNQLFKAVAICLKAYRLRLDDPTVATFLFSASYDTGPLKGAAEGATFEDWRGAFATRVFPATRIMPDLLAQARGERGEPISWEDYASQAFDERLARQFYGLNPDELKCNGVAGLTSIGAHPLVSVISGAFLCLSDGAILDLPPFSNFRMNVSWIDDHLKYSLHRELRHLTSLDLKLAEPPLSDAKLDDVMVAKGRARIDEKFAKDVLEKYLPTLLWGTVVDAWINPDPLLKCRPDDLSEEERSRWRELLNG